jgi:hypothetical protein
MSLNHSLATEILPDRLSGIRVQVPGKLRLDDRDSAAMRRASNGSRLFGLVLRVACYLRFRTSNSARQPWSTQIPLRS